MPTRNLFGRPPKVLTPSERDTIANMLAVNLPINAIARALDTSNYLVRKAMERQSFQDLLARKRIAVAKALEVTR